MWTLNAVSRGMLFAASFACSIAWAADGRIEISAAGAEAGGITPSDTAGYPVTIDTPGSYILTSDLAVPDADTNAIETSGGSAVTNEVRIDLNGFQIRGPANCGGADITCSSTGDGVGILVTENAWQLVVSNGTIVGMGSWAIDSVSELEVVDLRIISNGGGGLQFNGGTVSDSTISTNGGDGMRSFGPTLVYDNLISANKLDGVGCGECTIMRNTIVGNRGDGIEVQSDLTTVIGNTLNANRGQGINASGGPAGYGMNSIDPSIFGGGTVSGSATQIGTNFCDGNTTCP